MTKQRASARQRVLFLCFVSAFVVLGGIGGMAVRAQSNENGNPLRQQESESEPLTAKQTRLAERYGQLELLAGRLAELSSATQPRRAKLLRELVAQSRERDVEGRFNTIVDALTNDNLGTAATAQGELQVDLQRLLELLLQEDRDKQIESERKRIREYLAEVKRLIQVQRGIKARTEGGDTADELSKDQQRLAESTGKLQEQISTTEGTPSKPNQEKSGEDSQSPDDKPTDDKPTDDKATDDKATDDKSTDDDAKPKDGADKNSQPSDSQQKGDPKQGESQESESQQGESQQGEQNSEGKPTESAPSPGQEQSPGSPSESDSESSQQSPTPAERAQQKLKKAQQRMQQALERLEQAKRDKAVDRQEQALRELEQAKAELERILRQLREEELERMLVLLEARFRKMLDAQVEVYEQTKKLEASQSTAPAHEIEIASGRLVRQEQQIVREADRALVLLREDGTTVAFPEAIEQARDDMQSVAIRLGQVKLGIITQGIEEDIIAALEETLAALQQALKKAREQKSQPQQSQQSSPGEQPLVDQLAELRMIRALQNRINRRTQRYGEILGDQPAVEQELLEALDELAIRQERVFDATRDLDTGRNQ